MMFQEYAIYGVVVLFIGIMLLLCIDVIRRNNEILQSFKNEPNTTLEETLTHPEKPLAYPFYVDCSHDFIENHITHNSPDLNTLVPIQAHNL
jgi:hypothetical protein